ASIFLLNPNLLPINVGWRIGFFIGPVLGLIAIYLRYVLPESPRWLMTHGRNDEAEKIVGDIEAAAERQGVELEPVAQERYLEVCWRKAIGYFETAKSIRQQYPGRAFLGCRMMVTQAFL